MATHADDDNRIVLQPILGQEDCQSDYINACYVDVSVWVCVCVCVCQTWNALCYGSELATIVTTVCSSPCMFFLFQGYQAPKKFIATQGNTLHTALFIKYVVLMTPL